MGVAPPTGYNAWGSKVISAAGSYMDFYVVQAFGFLDLPPNTPQGWALALDQPRQYYASMASSIKAAFAAVVCIAYGRATTHNKLQAVPVVVQKSSS